MLNRIYGLIGVSLLVLPQAVIADDESALLLKSRELVAEYATLLQAELQSAMASGGPVAAISVCKDQAPRIAADLSNSSGASVRRTSLQTRNANNEPDDWEFAVLGRFDALETAEYIEVAENGVTRYMKAIPIAPPCLSCHGVEIAPAIQEKLDQAYPHDRARGYELGDIRGAFSISWPADQSP